jgi:hypothetical protein
MNGWFLFVLCIIFNAFTQTSTSFLLHFQWNSFYFSIWARNWLHGLPSSRQSRGHARFFRRRDAVLQVWIEIARSHGMFFGNFSCVDILWCFCVVTELLKKQHASGKNFAWSPKIRIRVTVRIKRNFFGHHLIVALKRNFVILTIL